MSLWEERQVNGPGLYALIIGVSEYKYLPGSEESPATDRVTLGLKKLKTPATGAFRFAQWLKTSYWHPTVKVKKIRLLLSPSDFEIANVPGLREVSSTQPRATTQEVWAAMQAWQLDTKGDPEGIAVLYASGHGIQWGSKDDAIVLLEDFSSDQMFLNQTIDVGGTLQGMSGAEMPQIQMFFCDACSIDPKKYHKYVNAGHGLSLRTSLDSEDLRAAPLYFAACPGTAAMGHRGNGTYFAEALLESLNGAAMEGIDTTADSSTIVGRYVHVKVTHLIDGLQSTISRIAARDGEKQEVRVGGIVRPGVFSASEKPPRIETQVDIDPDAAAQALEAQLWNSDLSVELTKRAKCWERPAALGQVPWGVHQLKLYGRPPYKTEQVRAYLFDKPPLQRIEIKL